MTSLTPAGAPRVTNDPVLSGAGDTPANNGNGVVVLAASSVKDTTTVGHEARLGLNVDGNGARGDSALGVPDTRDTINSSSGTNASAGALSGCVGVGRAGGGTAVALDPLEGS